MGFFKFLKKRDITEEDILDIPPLPPLSEQTDDIGVSSLEEEIPPPMIESPESALTAELLPETEDINIITKAPETEYRTKKPTIQQEIFPKAETQPVTSTETLVTEPSHFIKLMRYKSILDEITLSKSEARSAVERLLATNQVSDLEVKSLSRLKSVLEDMQKKLITMDKILVIR